MFVLGCLAVFSCTQEPAPDSLSLFQYLPSSQTNISFTNKVIESHDRCINQYDYFYNGGGVSIGDFNNDRLPDVFFTGNDVSNRLYINQGDLEFQDVTFESGLNSTSWCTGSTVVDINQDGWDDIYVCVSGPDWSREDTRNQLFVNQQDGTFLEQAADYGIDDNSLSSHAIFFDYDNDGKLDLWVVNHGVRNMANKAYEWLNAMERNRYDFYGRFCSTLYRNDGETFEDVTQEAGVYELGFGLGAAVADFDHDGDLDVFTSNDYFLPDKFWINQGDGTFEESAENKLSHTSFFSMGSATADINNDGWEDLAVLDMTPEDHYRSKMLMASMNVNEFRFLTEDLDFLPQYMTNSLFLNNGYGAMSEVGQLAGISLTDWSWAPIWGDFDNDGLVDLYVTNGIKRDMKHNDWRIELMESQQDSNWTKVDYFEYLQQAESTPLVNPFFFNQNGLQFEKRTKEVGLTRPSFSNGGATADLDGDGDLEIIVNNLDGEAFVIKNNTVERESGSFLRLDLRELSFQQGVRVKVETELGTYSGIHAPQGGFQSCSQAVFHIGLGESKEIMSVEYTNELNLWVELEEVELNSITRIETPAEISGRSYPELAPIFGNATEVLGQPIIHEESDYDDFEHDILLPHRQSRLGPGLAVGDVNGDELDDFFIGGAEGQKSRMMRQIARGGFKEMQLSSDLEAEDKEVLGAHFMDVDHDGDLDLYIAYSSFEGNGRDGFYRNDGLGNFQAEKLERAQGETSQVICEMDQNGDGWDDLFVFGRTTPGGYPLPPKSHLLTNQEGQLIHATTTSDSSWADVGMVTDAAPFEHDGISKLLVVGEWMEPSFLDIESGNYPIALCPDVDLSGWWYHATVADFDNDGDQDILLGNVGLNNKFHPSEAHPLHCFSGDLDDNGTHDIVLSKDIGGTLLPVRGKECSSSQMPFITDSFPTFSSFAKADLPTIFSAEVLGSAYHLEATTFASMVLRNDDGDFVPVELPPMAQISPIRASVIRDLNGDGFLDAIVAGNNSQTEVETVPYDAGKGLILWGKGDCTFEADYLIQTTGLFLPGDVVDMKAIYLGRDSVFGILAAKNNSRLNLLIQLEEHD